MDRALSNMMGVMIMLILLIIIAGVVSVAVFGFGIGLKDDTSTSDSSFRFDSSTGTITPITTGEETEYEVRVNGKVVKTFEGSQIISLNNLEQGDSVSVVNKDDDKTVQTFQVQNKVSDDGSENEGDSSDTESGSVTVTYHSGNKTLTSQGDSSVTLSVEENENTLKEFQAGESVNLSGQSGELNVVNNEKNKVIKTLELGGSTELISAADYSPSIVTEHRIFVTTKGKGELTVENSLNSIIVEYPSSFNVTELANSCDEPCPDLIEVGLDKDLDGAIEKYGSSDVSYVEAFDRSRLYISLTGDSITPGKNEAIVAEYKKIKNGDVGSYKVDVSINRDFTKTGNLTIEP